MATEDAKRDSNYVTSMLFVGTDGFTHPAEGDEVTGRLLVDNVGGVATEIVVANEATDTTCFPVFVTAATGNLEPKSNAGLTFNSNTSRLNSTILASSSLTASELIATDGSKNLVSLAVATYPSLTELSYVKGVTSAIQTQLNARGALVAQATAEVTGTATGNNANTLSTVSGFSIAAGHMVEIIFQCRKTTGAASAVKFGFNINGTLVSSSAGSSFVSHDTNEAESGYFVIRFVVPDASYPAIASRPLDFSYGGMAGTVGLSALTGVMGNFSGTAAIPDGPMTSFTITGDAVNGAITMATKNLRVYDLG